MVEAASLAAGSGSDADACSKCLDLLLLQENLAWISSKCSDWDSTIAKIAYFWPHGI